MTIGSGRLITACDHRLKVYGMTKEEVMRRARERVQEQFQIRLTEVFLRRFTTLEIYRLMRAAAQGKWHRILSDWKAAHIIAAATKSVGSGHTTAT